MTRARRRGIPFVVAAPSGTGKTTVCRAVVGADPDIVFSVSHTTRARRAGEVEGRDYHFVTSDEFRALVDAGAFLEWAVYNGHHYGTSHAALEAALGSGRDVLLEIEVQGARQVRERRRDARLLFLLPPSLSALEERLRARGTDSEEEMTRRLGLAVAELSAAEIFDYAVVNDSLDACVERVLAIMAAERAGEAGDLRRQHGVAAAAPLLAEARRRWPESPRPPARAPVS